RNPSGTSFVWSRALTFSARLCASASDALPIRQAFAVRSRSSTSFEPARSRSIVRQIARYVPSSPARIAYVAAMKPVREFALAVRKRLWYPSAIPCQFPVLDDAGTALCVTVAADDAGTSTGGRASRNRGGRERQRSYHSAVVRPTRSPSSTR